MNKTNASHPLLVVFAVVLFLCGNGGHIALMQEAHASNDTATPIEGKAVIVFVRTNSSDATSVDYRRSPVFKLKSGESEPELVGILPVKTKIAYQIDPGKYLFMVVGESAEFMTAEVLPNTTYYVLILARVGSRTAIYSFKAVDKQEQNSKDFRELIASAKWVENTSASLNWAASNMVSIQAAQTKNYKLWTSKPESERSSLFPNDGVGGYSTPSERAASGGASVEKPASSVARDASESSKPVTQPLRPTAQLDGAAALVVNAERSIIANPQDALAWRTLGDAHASSGEWNRAARAYEEALRLAPRDSQSLTNLASTYCKRFDRNQLNNAVEETRKTNPGLSEQIVRRCILP